MILISPFSRAMRDKKENPKNYPYWVELINLFLEENDREEIIQIGVSGEKQFVQDFRKDFPLKNIERLINQCEFWISVDNFFPHFCHHLGKKGVVIWGMSDPNIYGYTENLNILKDIKYLRKNQFDFWENYTFDKEVFLEAEKVFEIIKDWRTKNGHGFF